MDAKDAIGRNKLFGAYVRRRRLQHEWTQEEMAAHMRPTITAQYISKLENGRCPNTLSVLVEVARVFGDSLGVLLREAGLIEGAAEPLTDGQRRLIAATQGMSERHIWATVRFLREMGEAREKPDQ